MLILKNINKTIQCEYIFMSPEIESPVFQCVMNQGPYQCPNSCTQNTDSPPRELGS